MVLNASPDECEGTIFHLVRLGPGGFVLGPFGFALGTLGILDTNMLVLGTQNACNRDLNQHVGGLDQRSNANGFAFWWNIGFSHRCEPRCFPPTSIQST